VTNPDLTILGCKITPLTMSDAAAWCLDACLSNKPAKIILTANASHLVEMQHNPALKAACYSADLVVADGMSIVWAGRLLGGSVLERVTGIDLLTHLLSLASQHGLRLYFLGAKRNIIERFVSKVRSDDPALAVAGFRDGYFSPSDDEAIIADISASQADILVVGMPSPFKDTWCQRYRDQFGVKLIIGVGGSFDVLSGAVKRAPWLLQKTGLEWAWRLLLEPRRLWRRYLIGNSEFVYLVFREYVREALGQTAKPQK
jgi:N-acetylglucosaminyldiphosphoundecaprenol N-acetyl-beta-D-mannosaminyltransferase